MPTKASVLADIDRLFGNTNVSIDVTLDDLESIRDHASQLIETLKEAMDN